MQQFLNPCFGPKVNVKAQLEIMEECSVNGKMTSHVSPPSTLHFRIDMHSSLGLRRQLSKCSSTVKVATKYKGQFLSWQIELLLTIAFIGRRQKIYII